jgi:hypothetical protein
MDTEQIVVLAFSAIAVAPLIWVERRSRKNRKAEAEAKAAGSATAHPAIKN